MSQQGNVVCLECGAINRLPAGRSAAEAKCGRCDKPLFTGHPKDVDAAMLTRQIQKDTIPVVVDVWAAWCGPCQAMAPEYERAAAETEPHARFLKLDSDAEQAMSASLGIRSIPTMLLFSGGKEVGRVSGAMSAARIRSWVADRLNQAGR
jgi:thioredoxin 2